MPRVLLDLSKYTINDFFGAISSINDARYAMAAIYGLVLFEYIASVDHEVELIHRAKCNSSKIAYLLCRYYPLFIWPVIMWAYIGDHDLKECLKVGRTVHALLAPFQFFSQAVMLMRAYAFSGRDRRILALLGICYSALVGLIIWVFCAHRFDPATYLYLLIPRTGCFPNYGDEQTANRIGYAILAATLMDTISLTVVLIYCYRIKGREVSLGRYFVNQGLFAFAAVVLLNSISAILYYRSGDFHIGIGLPLIMVIPNLIACRLILQLRRRINPTESQIRAQNSIIIRNALDLIRTATDAWVIEES